MFSIELMTFIEWFVFSSVLYVLAYMTRKRTFYWLALSGLIVGVLLLVGSFSWEVQWTTFIELVGVVLDGVALCLFRIPDQ